MPTPSPEYREVEVELSPTDLLPLAHPEKLGLPFKRRELGRRIADGRFPADAVLQLGGRLFTTRGALEKYKEDLIARGAQRDANGERDVATIMADARAKREAGKAAAE